MFRRELLTVELKDHPALSQITGKEERGLFAKQDLSEGRFFFFFFSFFFCKEFSMVLCRYLKLCCFFSFLPFSFFGLPLKKCYAGDFICNYYGTIHLASSLKRATENLVGVDDELKTWLQHRVPHLKISRPVIF